MKWPVSSEEEQLQQWHKKGYSYPVSSMSHSMSLCPVSVPLSNSVFGWWCQACCCDHAEPRLARYFSLKASGKVAVLLHPCDHVLSQCDSPPLRSVRLSLQGRALTRLTSVSIRAGSTRRIFLTRAPSPDWQASCDVFQWWVWHGIGIAVSFEPIVYDWLTDMFSLTVLLSWCPSSHFNIFQVCSLPSLFVSSVPYAGNAMTTSVVGACLVGLLLYVVPVSGSSYLDPNFHCPLSVWFLAFGF